MNKGKMLDMHVAESSPIKRYLASVPTVRAMGVERLARLAVRQAMIEHKEAGMPVATWEDGKVVWIAAEDIVIADPDEA